MKELLEELIECKRKLLDLKDSMDDIENILMGKEIEIKNSYGSVMHLSQDFNQITIYLENEDECWEETLFIDELLELLK